MNKEVDVRHPSGSSRGKHAVEDEGNERKDTHHDQTYAKHRESRKELRQELCGAHLRSPTLAMCEALRRVDDWEDVGSPRAGGRRN